MARAIWKGSLTFGLVNVPVELYPAVRETRPRFHLLHKTDSSRVEYQRVCAKEGKVVDWNDLVKGYEYEKNHFVVLTKEDLETAALERSRRIDILDFVKDDEIDDRFFETSYYLTPSSGSERAYNVLREALHKTRKVGIGRVMLRNVQHLAAVNAVGHTLALTLMRFANELVEPETLDVPTLKVDAREISLAESIIDRLTRKWDPSRYADEYQQNLMRVIRAKLKGKRPRLTAEPESRPADVVDLMTRLQQSLEQRRRPAHARNGHHAKKKRSRAA